jgi:hypothetical protein
MPKSAKDKQSILIIDLNAAVAQALAALVAHRQALEPATRVTKANVVRDIIWKAAKQELGAFEPAVAQPAKKKGAK